MRLFLGKTGNAVETMRFDGDQASIQFIGDSQPTLDQNQRIRNGFDHQKSRKKGWELIASIDCAIAYLWLTKYGINVYNKHHLPRIVKLLNDPDWKLLKTTDEVI